MNNIDEVLNEIHEALESHKVLGEKIGVYSNGFRGITVFKYKDVLYICDYYEEANKARYIVEHDGCAYTDLRKYMAHHNRTEMTVKNIVEREYTVSNIELLASDRNELLNDGYKLIKVENNGFKYTYSKSITLKLNMSITIE